MRTASTKPGRHLLAGVLTALILASAASVSVAGPAAAADSPGTHTLGEIVVGIPDLGLPGASRAGGVDVYFPDGRQQRLTEQKLGLVGANQGDFHRFGAAAVVAQLNDDAYPDLLIGAPGLRSEGVKGRVVLLFGSAQGFTAAGAQVLTTFGPLADEFGAALALSGRDLYVGAPRFVEDKIDSGAVIRYTLDHEGKATLFHLLTEASTGLGSVLQANQRFGAVLAPADGGMIIGLPNKNVGTATGAGEMIRFHSIPGSTQFTAEIWTQASPGVPGVPEAGDHFGAAVTQDGHAVGVPGEDLGRTKDAGSVQTFRNAPGGGASLTPGVAVTQASKGVPGGVEAGDRFGAALASGIFTCWETVTMAVGSPGEDIGTAADAGSVTFVGLPVSDDAPTCAPTGIRQNGGLPGRAEAGDATGTALARVSGDADLDQDRFDTLLVGAPGEDIGTSAAHRNTGRAMIWGGFPTTYTQSFGFQGGDLPSLGYGRVFGWTIE